MILDKQDKNDNISYKIRERIRNLDEKIQQFESGVG